MNDGNGKFTKGSIPEIATNASCVKVADYDKDGYIDVFIGGRAVAGKYGLPGRSYLLHNNNGNLKDETPEVLKLPGMVTDAVWTDMNHDTYPDLMIVGEWMPVIYFINNKGSITSANSIPNSAGLWNCITAADIDKDGDIDFALGNWGQNSRFKATVDKPMEMYVSDFDKNESIEPLITYYWPDGKSHLYNSKEDITSQLPYLKKKILQYKDYAGKAINDIIGNDLLNKASRFSIQTLSSSILINEGNNNYKLSALPEMCQASPVFTMLVNDFDKDGNLDILTGGNLFDLKPDIGRLDANASCLLQGNGKGSFKWMSPLQSGLQIKGQLRDAALITVNTRRYVLLARNNDAIIFLQFN
jgi:hypothetical protein